MARPRDRELTQRELEVMHVFWKHTDLTASEVRDQLEAAGLKRAYPTVANLVRGLAEKGLLEQTNDDRPFTYRPAKTAPEIIDALSRTIESKRTTLSQTIAAAVRDAATQQQGATVTVSIQSKISASDLLRLVSDIIPTEVPDTGDSTNVADSGPKEKKRR